MTKVAVCSDFGAQEDKICHCFHFFPSLCCEVMGSDSTIISFFEYWVSSQISHFLLSPSLRGSKFLFAFLICIQVSQEVGKVVWYFHLFKKTLFLGGSKITADVDCSHEIKRCLLLGREVMTNLESILKSRDITLPTKVCLVKALVFPVVMCGCENWTIKKSEHWRIDAFELWCWRRLLRVPWTARRSNQSILKEINPEYSLEGLILKLKL